MCGVAGYVGHASPGLLDKMLVKIKARGPDDIGKIVGEGFEIGHTRLSIVDLSGGSQPMSRESGRFIVSYNGEIYNYHELRKLIEAHGKTFQTLEKLGPSSLTVMCLSNDDRILKLIFDRLKPVKSIT